MIQIIGAEKWEETYLKKNLKTISTKVITGNTIKPNKDTQILTIFIYTAITKKELDQLPNLKIIATRSTGFDHIDVEECKKRGITVCNVPTYGENTVAEHAMALLLSLSRKIPPSVKCVDDKRYCDANMVGFDLKDKNVGVIGGGHIGMRMVRMVKGFAMHVKVFDIYHQDLLRELLHFEYTSLEKLFEESDIISLHAPLNKHTQHIIDEKSIKKMKKGVIIINTARGGLISNKALWAGLQSGHIGYAGLDVIEHEKALRDSEYKYSKAEKELVQKIVHHPHVIYTPHNAFNSIEALTRILDTTIQNVKSFKKGKPVNVVNK